MTLHPISGKSYLLLFALLLISALSPAQTAVPVVLAPVPQLQFFDASGRPLSFGCVSTFQSQTTTPLATFTDFTGQVQNQNPVLLNAGGSANIWLQSGQAYSLVVKSSGGTNCALGQTLYTVDGVGGGASQLNTVVTPSGGSAAFTVQSQNQLFTLTLTANTAGQPVTFVGATAPALITFQITEDGAGAHTFSWPSNLIGAAPIDTTALHTTSQTFIWNGTTIMPVGSGFNSAGNELFPGTLLGAAALIANPGTFAGTSQVDYIQSIINGCSPAALETGFGGPNPVFEEAIVGCAAVPGTSTKVQVNGIAGLVTNSGTTTRTVGVFGLANALVANTMGVWGANFAVSSTVGFGGNPIYAAENDCNVGNTTDVCYGLLVAGNWSAQPTTSFGLFVSQPGPNSGTSGTNHWTGGLFFNTGATAAPASSACAVCFNPVGTGVNKQSQGMTFVANDPSSGLNVVTMGELPSGYFFISNTKAGTGLQVPNLLLTSGLSADGAGFKHKRFGATCTTTASIGNSCTTTFSWTTAFADANYTPVCSPIGPANGPVFSIDSFNATGVTVRVYTFVALASGYSGVDCFGGHD